MQGSDHSWQPKHSGAPPGWTNHRKGRSALCFCNTWRVGLNVRQFSRNDACIDHACQNHPDCLEKPPISGPIYHLLNQQGSAFSTCPSLISGSFIYESCQSPGPRLSRKNMCNCPHSTALVNTGGRRYFLPFGLYFYNH